MLDFLEMEPWYLFTLLWLLKSLSLSFLSSSSLFSNWSMKRCNLCKNNIKKLKMRNYYLSQKQTSRCKQDFLKFLMTNLLLSKKIAIVINSSIIGMKANLWEKQNSQELYTILKTIK
jgi:hypothetical protein